MHRKLPVWLVGSGIFVSIFSFIMGWFGLPYLIKSQIRGAAKLEEGSETWKMWQESPDNIMIFLKFHFFNYTNPEEIYAGGKPKVVEMGPYSFKEKRIKVDIEPGSYKDSIKYRQKMWLTYLPEYSKGSDNDVVTFLNIPFVGVAKMALEMTDIEFLHEQLDVTLAQKGEKLFKQATVKEILFDGWSIQPYLDLLNDPMVEQIAEDGVEVPEQFKNGKFALYENKNGTDDGLYEINTGKSNPLDFGRIHTWNEMTHLPWWKTDECNEIKGSDGSLFPPFLTKESVLYAYNPEVCRSLFLRFEKEVELDGITLFRFAADKTIFQGTKSHPPNECYCKDTDPVLCERDGLMQMAGCAKGAPVTLSQPHFFGGDRALINDIDGLSPREDIHKVYLDIEPTTAATLRAAKRLQMNMDVVNHYSMPSFEALGKTRAYPVMWAEEAAELPEDFVNMFKILTGVMEGIELGKWIGLMIGLCLMSFGFLLVKMKSKNLDKVEQVTVK